MLRTPLALPAAFAIALLPSLAAAQTTVTLTPSIDNTLYESPTGALSNGVGFGLFAGVNGSNEIRRTLVQFDVSAIPAGARVIAAQLEVNVTRTAAAIPVDVDVHRVLAAWGEGTSNATGQEGGGAPATPGDATWLHSIFPSVFWTTPGGDYVPVRSERITTPTFGNGTSPQSAGLAADVEFWLANPAQNFGWLLKTNEALPFVARRFDSKDAGTGSAPPTLTITYLMPGFTATWGTGCPVGAQTYTFAINGAPIGGQPVALQHTNGPAGALAANLMSLSLDPAGTPLLPSCNLYLPFGGLIVTYNLFVMTGAGTGFTPLPIPSGFAGYTIAVQGAALDTSPAGFVLSNAGVAVLQ